MIFQQNFLTRFWHSLRGSSFFNF